MDVGCGTGLCGPLLRERAKKLDGLDLSAQMIARARERDVYDELFEGDLESTLAARPERYDAIASAATLIHFGDLGPPLKACAAALRPEGWMAFTVFPNTDGGVGVLPFFCHAHSPEHIRERAKDAGFEVVSIEEDVHEYHGDKPVPGLVVVLRKGKSA
jgi:predicted TPR repeat methyltransferase